MLEPALVFDTEASGFYRKNLSNNHKSQNGIVQLAFRLFDPYAEIKMEYNSIIFPEYFTSIDSRAQKVHGISIEDCMMWGIPLREAMGIFYKALKRCKVIVAHNISFDIKFIKASFECLGVGEPAMQYLDSVPKYCTMGHATDVLKLPYKNGQNGNKKPSLSECYTHFFDKEIENAHDAMADVKACADVYFKLRENE